MHSSIADHTPSRQPKTPITVGGTDFAVCALTIDGSGPDTRQTRSGARQWPRIPRHAGQKDSVCVLSESRVFQFRSKNRTEGDLDMYGSTILRVIGGALLTTPLIMAAGGTVRIERSKVTLHVVFNNTPCKTGLQTGWGFACLIEGLDRTVLFDTGGDGDILLSNMRQLGLDPEAVEAVVLSHFHGDHTGGLSAFLERKPAVTVFMPESFPSAFRQELTRQGATIETTGRPRRLFGGAYSTGEMGGTIREQALIVDTAQGLIVMTGCAHPNVADMAERAHAYLGKPIYLLMGGFHLRGESEAQLSSIIRRLKTLGVEKVAPSHCTGDTAIAMFRDAWKSDFIEGGLGAVIEVSR
jgi:7,8-dihydropterin-6-yl-methyl-4-(beta-D-ribofuranosyl)aminobenzene 5'-phosphate synthase